MPFGVVVTKANAHDGWQTEAGLKALVMQPPPPAVPVPQPDPRDLPRRRPMGPTATSQPRRGENRQGVGKIRNAVEHCHNCLAQVGCLFRRFDCSARRYLAWIEMAAGGIFVRSSFVR